VNIGGYFYKKDLNTIKSPLVQLYFRNSPIKDVLGRTLYQLKGSNTTEVYSLSNLSQSAYIAKVELSNGQIVTKKALKRI